MSDGNGRVFLITGASGGIGEATARHAAAAGYRVVLAARSTEKLGSLADEVDGLAVTCDVTEWTDQEAMVEADTPELWRAMVLTNVYGVALTIRACLDALVETKGHLILTSSLAGRRSLPGSLYSATKFAVTSMGESARLELNGTGVRVTLIEPGMVDTPFFDEPPVGMLEADDVARAVMFAVSQPPHVDVNEILVRPTAQET